MNSCLGVSADDDGCASGQPAGGVSVRAGRSRLGAPALVNVYGRARQHAGVLDAGSRASRSASGTGSPLPTCASTATRWPRSPTTVTAGHAPGTYKGASPPSPHHSPATRPRAAPAPRRRPAAPRSGSRRRRSPRTRRVRGSCPRRSLRSPPGSRSPRATSGRRRPLPRHEGRHVVRVDDGHGSLLGINALRQQRLPQTRPACPPSVRRRAVRASMDCLHSARSSFTHPG